MWEGDPGWESGLESDKAQQRETGIAGGAWDAREQGRAEDEWRKRANQNTKAHGQPTLEPRSRASAVHRPSPGARLASRVRTTRDAASLGTDSGDDERE